MVDTLMVFQAVLAVLLIIIVLLQFGKGAEAGLLSAGDSVMSGSQKGNILSKITVVISFFFFANSVYLAKVQSSKSEKSLLDSEAPIATPFNNDAARAEQEAAAKAAQPEAAKTEPAPGTAADTAQNTAKKADAKPGMAPAPKANEAKPAAAPKK